MINSPLLAAPRSHPRDSIRWMRWDLPCRVLPLLLLPLALLALTPLPARTLGLTAHGAEVQLLLALLLGPPMGLLSWWYRRRFIRWVVVPTGRDNLLQSSYYVVLNAPAEELFFRGLLLGWLQGYTGTALAWLFSTLVFGLYHVPARWGWRAVAGVTIGGGIFGGLFLLASGCLLLPTVVHAFATCGFLSAGPWAAHALELRRSRVLTPPAGSRPSPPA